MAGAATVLLGAGTAAGAVITSTPPVSGGVVNACYQTTATNGSHAVLLENTGHKCPSGYTNVTWNQVGQTGPPGPSTAGASGLGVVTETASAAGNIVAKAFCPAAEPNVIGGGGNVRTAGDTALYDVDNVPMTTPGAEGWAAGGSPVSVSDSVVSTAYAICSK